MVFLGAARSLAAHSGSAALHAGHLHVDSASSSTFLQSALLRLWAWTAELESIGLINTIIPENDHVKVLDPEKGHHERKTVLFDEKDTVPWIVFTLSFFVLVIFDNAVLHRRHEKLSLLQALLFTTFWIACAAAFCVYVYTTRGPDDAFSWGTGYLLEWMLSVDNLFVFQRIFTIFKTPDEQKHKPLFYGIIGAIVFRMLFFLIEELLMHHVWWIHIVFGAFLIYTGIKAVTMDDEEDNPTEGWLFKIMVKHINYVDRYDPDGRFFTPVEVNKDTNSYLEDKEDTESKLEKVEVKYRATRLVLVVVCLEITDLVFAIDSVSAIVAQIPDLFLAYTACVFAMLGLRALFFAIDELVKMFSLLSYGVAFILVFLGVKLILLTWVHISPKVVCAILVSTIAFSVIASLVKDRYLEHEDPPEETSWSARRAKDSEGPPEETGSPRRD